MCFSDIVILYMYITKYGCVFLKLVYTWQWISFPCILLGSLPLAHNAQHSLVLYNVYVGVYMYVYTCTCDSLCGLGSRLPTMEWQPYHLTSGSLYPVPKSVEVPSNCNVPLVVTVMAVNAKRAAVIAVCVLLLLIVLKVFFLKSAEKVPSLTQFTESANTSPETPLEDVLSKTEEKVPSLTQFKESANISPETPLEDVLSKTEGKVPSQTQLTENANISLQELATSLVVVTGISDNHFEEAMDMIGSVHHFLPDTKIILYDVGLSKSHLQALHCIENIEVRHFNFAKYPDFGKRYGLGGHTWKVHVVNEVSKQYSVFLWLDASARLRKPLTDGFLQRLFQFPLAAGHKHCKNTNMVAFVLDSTLEHLHLTRESMRGVLGFESNIVLFKMDNITRFLMDQWVDCALHKKCMYGVNRPKQHCRFRRPDQGTFIAYNGCQRFDQPTLNLIVAKYFGKKLANEIAVQVCIETFDVIRHATTVWRDYIKRSCSS